MATTTTTIVIDPLLRLEDVLKVFPVSRTTWYQGIEDGIYPAPIKIGRRASAWRSSAIQSLINRLEAGLVYNDDI